MRNNTLVKIALFALVIVSIAIFSLAVETNHSLAQGPGGGGNGGNGQGGQGNNNQAATQGFGQQNAGQGIGRQPSAGQAGSRRGYLNDLPVTGFQELPADVIEALTAGLTDEHHAYDTYQAVIDQFGAVRPFTTIQRAEANHIAALERLFERHSLAVPEIAPLADIPTFASLADACSAGAAAEVANFGLYDQWLATVQDYPDMVRVFTALRNASEFQHLPAFESCAG